MQFTLFETPTEWAALILVLFAGWLFGLASASGGRKWRRRLQEEERAHARYRTNAEQELRAAERQIQALEAENARLKAAPARTAAGAAPAVATAPVAASPASPPVQVVEEKKESHSTTALAGAAVAGATLGALIAKSRGTPEPEAHAEKVSPVRGTPPQDAGTHAAGTERAATDAPGGSGTHAPPQPAERASAAAPATAAAGPGAAVPARSADGAPASDDAPAPPATGHIVAHHEWLPPHVRGR